MSWRTSVLHLLRVPHDPEPPPGSAPRLFRAAPNFFKLRLLRWGVTRLFALAGLLFAISFVEYLRNKGTPRMVIVLMQLGEIFGWIAFAAEAFLGWCIVRLDYEQRWYMVNDRAIRIREGILNVREKTIALANVQNIAVRQGPLQRALGIADVEVKTAGGGGSSSDSESKKGGEPMHVAYFRGVDNAEEIRDLVREGVRMQKSAGLGDPDEVEESDVVAKLLVEAQALRARARSLS